MREGAEGVVRMIPRFGTVKRRNFVLLIKIEGKKDEEGKDNFVLGHPGLMLIPTWRDYQG